MSKLFFSQNGLSQYYLYVNNNDIEASAFSANFYINVTITPPESIPTIESDQAWLTTSYNSSTGDLTVSVTKNTSGSFRFGAITLTHPYNTEIKVYISVMQEP